MRKMKVPKVSVIVPVYNTEKYLEKCLDSLIFQTLEDVEIVIVNDGSTDGSKEILEKYKAKYPERIQLMHKENGGQATARNLALKHCRGEYVGFLDSDDFIKAEMFEKMYTAAVKEQADYVSCGYTDITYEDGKEIVLQKYVASKKANETKDMFFGALASPFLHLYKREILEESKVEFTEGYIYEDTAFYLNLIPYIERIVTIEEALAVRVRRSNSTMSTFKKERVRHIMPVLESTIEYYKKNGFLDAYFKELEFFCVKVLLCSSMVRICRVAKYRDSVELANETLQFIDKYFANYRKSTYFKGGWMNVYMKSFNRCTSKVYLALFRFVNKFKRVYS